MMRLNAWCHTCAFFGRVLLCIQLSIQVLHIWSPPKKMSHHFEECNTTQHSKFKSLNLHHCRYIVQGER